MKILILTLAALTLSNSAMASSLQCDLQQSLEGVKTSQVFEVQGSNDPHGSILYFSADQFEDVQGFVSIQSNQGKEFSVISLNSKKWQLASSSISQLVIDDQFVHQQAILPSTGLKLSAVVVDCIYKK